MMTPRKCPSCGCVGSMVRYVDEHWEIVRCLVCNIEMLMLAPKPIGK